MLSPALGAGEEPKGGARRARQLGLVTLLLGVLAVVAIVSLGFGRVQIPPATVAAILASTVVPLEPGWTDAEALIVLGVRLPRVVAAVLVGAALAAAGAAYQNLFRNPIVSPDILGVSAGAGFGASLGVMLRAGEAGIQGLAFASGLLAVAVCFAIGQAINRHSMIVLVLVGVVIAAFFQAMISILKIVADPVDVLPTITFWLLGGLNKVTPGDLPLAAAVIALSLVALFTLRWQINVMSLGPEEARTLGVNVGGTRLLLVIAATLMTAAAVSVAGIVGWVGLVVPHMARILVGAAFDRLLPVTVVLGGLFLLLVDDVSRAASAMEIPLGITTSVIGAPLFLFLLLRVRTTWA